jgi:hypothetical protein
MARPEDLDERWAGSRCSTRQYSSVDDELVQLGRHQRHHRVNGEHGRVQRADVHRLLRRENSQPSPPSAIEARHGGRTLRRPDEQLRPVGGADQHR